MPRAYRLENLASGEVHHVIANNRKDAHDMSISIWPGQTVEVCTVEEYHDRQTYRSVQNNILDFLEGIEEKIPDGSYETILKYLATVARYVQELEVFFENRLQAGLAGEGEVSALLWGVPLE